ncbi:MAG TPA: hypothetical protein PK019_02080 [Sedimentisphaerales bacterium]|nr:hypothetical protein [Sedimentisphaerales bacterium]
MSERHYNQRMSAPSKQPKCQEGAPSPDRTAEPVDDAIDVSMLRANLALSPAERLRRHQVALDRMRRLQEARFL